MNHHQPVIKIMPLGDSITEGYQILGGYRTYLWEFLNQQNYSFQFVGSLKNGSDLFLNPEHEGHSGWRIDQIQDQVQGWLTEFRPDIILLMIGTNDIAQYFAPEVAKERLHQLLLEILKTLPEVYLLVASIPPITERFLNDRVMSYNQGIVDQVQEFQQKGYSIQFVDIFQYLDFDDLEDGFHPDQKGHEKIALAWQPILTTILSELLSQK